jgi:hypothetical protein
MAHFAQLDENNVVVQVIVINNTELLTQKIVTTDEGFINVSTVESEEKGMDFCKSLYGADTNWVQTSYNGSFRGKYAGIGDTYENGVFVAPEVPVVEAPVEEVAQVTGEVSTLSSTDIPALSSADVAPLTSADIPALTTSDLSAITTSDISSLG